MKKINWIVLCISMTLSFSSIDLAQDSSASLQSFTKVPEQIRKSAKHSSENEEPPSIAMSPSKDKAVLVKADSKFYEAQDDTSNYMVTHYSLWLLNIPKEKLTVLVRFDDYDRGIDYPSWSPDGKWIAFRTFSIGGHSPLTTMRTWVIDSSGHRLEQVKLIAPFDHFSCSPVMWKADHKLMIEGLRTEHSNKKWKDIKENFLYDCEAKKVEVLK